MNELQKLEEKQDWNLHTILEETGEPEEYGFDCYEEMTDFISVALEPDDIDVQELESFYGNPSCPSCLQEKTDATLKQSYSTRTVFGNDEDTTLHDLTYECLEHGEVLTYTEKE